MKESTRKKVELSEDIERYLEIGDTENIKAVYREDGILLKKVNQNPVKIPNINVLVAMGIGLLISFVTFFNYHAIPLSGSQSIATVVIIVGVFTGMINFIYAFIQHKKNEESKIGKGIHWRNFPVVLLAFTLVSAVSLLLIFKVLGELFYNVSFDIYTSAFIATIMIGIMNYMMLYLAQTITPKSLIRALSVIIIGGVSVAMVTNKNQEWWLNNFSFLGTPEATNSWEFNLTLMASALLMIALIDYVFVLMYEQYGKTKGLIALHILLIITAICLGGVGFFPYNDSLFYQSMHNRMAGYLVYLFIILIIGIRWMLPNVSKEFLKISYFVGALLLASVVFFQVIPYLSLTAFELSAFVLAFFWLLLLLNYLISFIDGTQDSESLQIK